MPMLLSLFGVLAVAALGVQLQLREDHAPADPAIALGITVPKIDQPTRPPPENLGAGRMTITRTTPSGEETIPFALYMPVNYNPERSYPLLVLVHDRDWAGKASVNQAALGLAWGWAEGADRDRYLVLVPPPRYRDDVLADLIANVESWWFVDRGPKLFASDSSRLADDLKRLSIPVSRVDQPAEVPAALAALPTDGLVRIVVRVKHHPTGLAEVKLIPVVSVRAGKMAGYEWNLKSFGLDVARRKLPEFTLDMQAQPGKEPPPTSYPISLTVTNDKGEKFSATATVEVGAQ
ncbi:MAG: hypothetical protein PHU85_07110 [Phycisphaerae bacterium]|nr:hypothetical protein [Phycisphaerae bacterium]